MGCVVVDALIDGANNTYLTREIGADDRLDARESPTFFRNALEQVVAHGAARGAEPVELRMHQIHDEQAARAQMRVHPPQAPQLVICLYQVGKTLDGNNCEIEVIPSQVKTAHIGVD